LWGAIDGIDHISVLDNILRSFGERNIGRSHVASRVPTSQFEELRPGERTLLSGGAGNYTSEFAIVGDDYSQDGPITAWRAVLIENNVIVALLQSRIWHSQVPGSSI